jgi:hypothetical protein
VNLYQHGFGFPLDREISYAVKVLRDAGIETYESCGGGSRHAFREPAIRFSGDSSDGLRAAAIATQHGLPVSELRRFWSVIGGELVGPQWEVTFVRGPLLRVQAMAERHGLMKKMPAPKGGRKENQKLGASYLPSSSRRLQ